MGLRVMMYKSERIRPSPEARDESFNKPKSTDRTAPPLALSDLERVRENYEAMREVRAARAAYLRMRRAVAVVILASLGLDGVYQGAQAQTADATCGTAYTVAKGDTLYKIADRVYRDGRHYEAILAANAPVLTSATEIAIGDKLLLPCLDGSGPKTRDEAVATGLLDPIDEAVAAPVEQAPAAEAALPATGEIHAVSQPGFAPYSDPRLPDGGLIPALVAQAFEGSAAQVDLAFSETAAGRLDMLAPGGGTNVGYPWFRPDCDAGDRLGPVARRQCDEFAFSDPVYAVTVGVYVRQGDALVGARTIGDLAGKRLCRPAGHFTFDLEEAGLTGPGAAIDLSGSAADCFRALAEGRVDAVTMTRHPVAPILRRTQLIDEVVEVRALAADRTLHVIAAKANPEGLELLAKVNEGMERLRTSGAWFDTVLAHRARPEALVN